MNRRTFLLNACGGCLGATGISLTALSCNTSRYLTGTLLKDGIAINKSDFFLKDERDAAYRSFVIIRNEVLLYPIILYRFSDDQYVALWMQCTHQGAELQAIGDSLQCPAHGSEFSSQGKVVGGPADQHLKQFPVTIDKEKIFIDLRKQ
ncbi:MAG: Rieske Fe-S protein [Citrobacter freundii]|nr:MAG: Rieske Fe-S protein [Citrobacter freundii]